MCGVNVQSCGRMKGFMRQIPSYSNFPSSHTHALEISSIHHVMYVLVLEMMTVIVLCLYLPTNANGLGLLETLLLCLCVGLGLLGNFSSTSAMRPLQESERVRCLMWL